LGEKSNFVCNFTKRLVFDKIERMKILDGLELSGYIKERQLKQVRALRQSWKVIPRLAIIRTGNNPVIDVYVRLKCAYGEDIGVKVDVYNPTDKELLAQIKKLNSDETVHGIIIQLPLVNLDLTESAINVVASEKDVDGLGKSAQFTPATAMAIDWLLVGYNVDLYDKNIAIIGNGRLVGASLAKLWKNQGLNVTVYDDQTSDLATSVKTADVIVTATGIPGLVTSDMVKVGTVVVDAGTASEHGKIVGDLDDDVRQRDDLTITPVKGGVGPLTVAALFDNIITSARRAADQKGQRDL
jgi:methylenetetrahydrofolate dehydrogenase (NADP+)/methenyltetrahydrofolate cyclohydrolase